MKNFIKAFYFLVSYIYSPIAFLAILFYQPASSVAFMGLVLLCLIPYVVAEFLWHVYNKINRDDPLQELKLEQILKPYSTKIFTGLFVLALLLRLLF